MTRKTFWTVLLAMALPAAVVGTFTWAGAGPGPQDGIVVAATDGDDRDRPAEPPRREDRGRDERGRDDRPRDFGPRPGWAEGPDRGPMPQRGPRGRMPEGPPDRPGMPPRMATGPERPQREAGRMGGPGQGPGAPFDPMQVGMMAITGLTHEANRKAEDVAADLEGVLGKTKTLGLRNAIRLTLRDIYRAQGQNDKVLDQLHALLAENDAFIQENKPKAER